jgi:twitching motility two-component system response regulator PilH
MAISKILIVDDAATDLMRLQDTLQATQCLIVTARSGQEAIEKAETEKPDLIFMDIMMDPISGYDACRKIKHNPHTAHIPVVFISVKQQKADQIWAKRQGGEALIGKPYTQDQIFEQIGRLS